MNTYTQQTIIRWKKNLFILFLISLAIIGCIYINYGEIIDTIIVQQNIMLELFRLKTHFIIFRKEIALIPTNSLPIIVSTIGYYSVIFIYVLFLCWLMLFAFSSYIKMYQRLGQELFILFETIIITIVYIFSIIPGLNLWLAIVGGLVIISMIVLLFLYWFYNRLTRNEKR